MILILLLGWGGNRGGYGGGFSGGSGDFPWLMSGQAGINANTNAGFQNAMLNDGITSIRDGIGNLSTQLCNCCGDMQMSLANGFAGVEQGANARQIANMQTAFAGQTAMAQGFNQLGSQFADCCCENRLGISNLNSTIARENCADREALNYSTRDIIDAITSNTQSIKDQLYSDKMDSKNEKIADLERQVALADLRASQIAQDGRIVDGIYNRLSTCPVGSMPVYGNQPIFTCPQNQNTCGCGCGCGA